jgi:glutathione synthase
VSAVLFVTDPLDTLLADIDATVGLMTAAQAEGADVWVCGPEDLSVVAGRLRARASRVVLHERARGDDHRWLIGSPWYSADGPRVVDVAATMEVAMLRIDPPVDARYLHATYLLDLAVAAGVRVVNNPAGVRALHEKLLALALPELSPATVVGTCQDLIEGFIRDHGAAVVKPVDGFAGGDVWLVQDGPGCRALVESATDGGRRQVIAQEYLPDVSGGNKRLFLLDGEIHGAVLRRPSAGDFRIGPPVAAAALDADDHRIAETLAPLLGAHGIAVAGVDVIGGRLIEVNVTCPGGMHKTDALLGTDLSGDIVRRLLDPGLVAPPACPPACPPAYRELCL